MDFPTHGWNRRNAFRDKDLPDGYKYYLDRHIFSSSEDEVGKKLKIEAPLPPEPAPYNGYNASWDAEANCGGISLPEQLAQEEYVLMPYQERLASSRKFSVLSRSGSIFNDWSLRWMNLDRIYHDICRLERIIDQPGGASEKDFQRLSELLHEQATALQDVVFLKEKFQRADLTQRYLLRENLEDFPDIGVSRNVITGQFREETNAVRRLFNLLAQMFPKSLTWTEKERNIRNPDFEEGFIRKRLELRDRKILPRKPTLFVRIIASIIISIASGGIIIAPMIIMSFSPSRTKSLLTVSVAVVIFGFLLSAVMRARSSEIFIATATYAAVLVVFVGTSGNGSG